MDWEEAIVDDALDEGVTGFVVGGNFFIIGVHEAFSFTAVGNFFAGFVEVVAVDGVFIESGGDEGGFVEEVFEVGAGESWGVFGIDGEVDIGMDFNFFGVDVEDF